MKDLNTVPVPAEGLTVQKVGSETIILTSAGEQLHTLDETGSFLWSKMDGSNNLGVLLDMLCTEYNVPRYTAQRDLAIFIRELEEKGLVLRSC